MGFLDRFKNNQDEEDDEDDEEFDDDEEDDEDEDEDDEDYEDDEEGSGGSFLGRFMGSKGIFGKILKKGGSDDDEEEEDEDEDEDDQDNLVLPASAPPVATGQGSVGVTAGTTAAPAAAIAGGTGGAAPSSGAAPPPAQAAGEDPAPEEVGALAEETPETASDALAPVEDPPLIDVDSKEQISGSGEVDLNDLFGEQQEVDHRLKSLAEAQEDTPAEVLAEELTGLLKELEEMMSG